VLSGSVLIVDDESAVGEFMRELLETWGIDAWFVPGPQAALDAVSAAPARFDAVITDQAMPRMTGLQLARALHEVRSDLPVLVYSGYSDGLAREDLGVAGIRAILRKPVEPAALEAALKAVLK
jgi:CheY-like chemotaxis protein